MGMKKYLGVTFVNFLEEVEKLREGGGEVGLHLVWGELEIVDDDLQGFRGRQPDHQILVGVEWR